MYRYCYCDIPNRFIPSNKALAGDSFIIVGLSTKITVPWVVFFKQQSEFEVEIRKIFLKAKIKYLFFKL